MTMLPKEFIILSLLRAICEENGFAEVSKYLARYRSENNFNKLSK